MATRKIIKGQTKQGHKEKDKRTDNTMATRIDNTMATRTDNTMATRKRIKGQTIQWAQGKG